LGRIAWFSAVVGAVSAYVVFESERAQDLTPGSWYNRIDSLQGVARLFSGDSSASLVLFGGGRVTDLKNVVFVVDNQFLTILIDHGVIGLILLLALIGYSLRRARPWQVLAMVFLIVMFLSYEVLTWPFSLMVFWATVGFGISRSSPVDSGSAFPAADPASLDLQMLGQDSTV
jgi:hypothetical protein